jgi:hypothetical protein
MQPSDFSETQFVVGFLREFLNRPQKQFWLSNYLRLPSTVTERRTGADVIVEGCIGSDFLQFKRSDYLQNRRGLPNDQRRVDKSYFDCFRFKVYNSQRTRQFETLRKLAKRPNNYCAYIAPLFHTFNEFDTHFARASIMPNSIEIECSQFNAGEFAALRYRNNSNHHILFNGRDNHCWFCSEPKIAKANHAILLKERQSREQIDFISHVDEIFNVLKDMDFPIMDLISETTQQKINIIVDTLYRKANIFWTPKFNI